MAKTKEQKQKEALERKRKFFHVYTTNWLDSQPGGERYKRHAKISQVSADRLASETEQALVRAAKEAHLDRHGNPLEMEHGGL